MWDKKALTIYQLNVALQGSRPLIWRRDLATQTMEQALPGLPPIESLLADEAARKKAESC